MKDTTKKLSDQCDELCRQIVRLRDKGICRNCGKEGTDTAHIHGRANKSTRWYTVNLIYLCNPCHEWFGDHDTAWKEFVLINLEADQLIKLAQKRQMLFRVNEISLGEIKAGLEQELAVLIMQSA